MEINPQSKQNARGYGNKSILLPIFHLNFSPEKAEFLSALECFLISSRTFCA
jgi:hypothetical protein